MPVVKVSEATGSVLDWMVASCENTLGRYVQPNEKRGTTKWEVIPQTLRYSTNWVHGGPIIESEGIDLYCNVPSSIASKHNGWLSSWRAAYRRCGFGTDMSYGPTPLIAAMRCYVTSRSGEEVEVPDGIT